MNKLVLGLALIAWISGPALAADTTTEAKKMETVQCDQHKAHKHAHGKKCGHESVEHEGHVDYKHDGHLHAEHDKHYDEHKTN